jgi:hypothetical protein
MNFEIQEERILQHLFAHHTNQPLNQDYSCLICYPTSNRIPNQQFIHFWNWLQRYYNAESYSSYSVTALPLYLQLFQEETFPTNSHRTTTYLVKLLFSFRYRTRPFSLTQLIL